MRQAFGALGPSLTQDLVLEGLQDRTAQQALDDGVDPQLIWDAVCFSTDLPATQRFPHRADPKK